MDEIEIAMQAMRNFYKEWSEDKETCNDALVFSMYNIEKGRNPKFLKKPNKHKVFGFSGLNLDLMNFEYDYPMLDLLMKKIKDEAKAKRLYTWDYSYCLLKEDLINLNTDLRVFGPELLIFNLDRLLTFWRFMEYLRNDKMDEGLDFDLMVRNKVWYINIYLRPDQNSFHQILRDQDIFIDMIKMTYSKDQINDIIQDLESRIRYEDVLLPLFIKKMKKMNTSLTTDIHFTHCSKCFVHDDFLINKTLSLSPVQDPENIRLVKVLRTKSFERHKLMVQDQETKEGYYMVLECQCHSLSNEIWTNYLETGDLYLVDKTFEDPTKLILNEPDQYPLNCPRTFSLDIDPDLLDKSNSDNDESNTRGSGLRMNSSSPTEEKFESNKILEYKYYLMPVNDMCILPGMLLSKKFNKDQTLKIAMDLLKQAQKALNVNENRRMVYQWNPFDIYHNSSLDLYSFQGVFDQCPRQMVFENPGPRSAMVTWGRVVQDSMMCLLDILEFLIQDLVQKSKSQSRFVQDLFYSIRVDMICLIGDPAFETLEHNPFKKLKDLLLESWESIFEK